jgi:hypothetical protein
LRHDPVQNRNQAVRPARFHRQRQDRIPRPRPVNVDASRTNLLYKRLRWCTVNRYHIRTGQKKTAPRTIPPQYSRGVFLVFRYRYSRICSMSLRTEWFCAAKRRGSSDGHCSTFKDGTAYNPSTSHRQVPTWFGYIKGVGCTQDCRRTAVCCRLSQRPARSSLYGLSCRVSVPVSPYRTFTLFELYDAVGNR